MEWYLKVLKKYATFEGRARRAEYWYFSLFNVLISFVVGFADGFISSILGVGTIGLSAIYILGTLVPSIAVTCRRLHDTGRSGWMQLIAIIPLIGPIILLVFTVQDSSFERNEYGPNPKRPASV
ncbi:DUF805 domain-containing protein [cf. Phormidesmis sp. LEGE 11477]|uniref:DUF805 domain-containing protein n=1 Tax=cf. Phormidesmis sp. LEGE 11477 TaxID=1828680 RepID=UPI0018819096|nr:DUF805 domain-containing protein [cf. Phormidesmis sp. LEGE 11477]MBE9063718.1 DUF805 domain-containing protein [cf. Phormidesmis sp. LEGE 11477]